MAANVFISDRRRDQRERVLPSRRYVSALVTRSGNPARVIEAALRGEILSVLDPRTIREAREVLAHPVFATKH